MSTATNPWKMKPTSGADFELPPGGSYPGCLVALIDLGTHDNTYQGKTTEQHRVLLVFELTAEHDAQGQTFKVAKDFTFSLNAKAKLRGFLESWEGAKFRDDAEIDLSAYMLRDAVVNLAEGTTGSGKRYVDISSVSRPMKGLTVPPRTVEPFAWTFDGWSADDEPPIPDWVPYLYGRRVVDDIKSSKEWDKLSPF